MNIRPWPDRDTLPIPLLVEHPREFAVTEAAVHAFEPKPDSCSACRGNCPTREACGLPIARATKPPRAAFWLLRLITAARLALLRWHLECLRDERDHYDGLGWASPIYLRNCLQQELQLMRAIRQLEQS